MCVCVCLSSSMAPYHPEFERAGQQPGLQVWRVENFELVPVPQNLYGGFYNGDAYLVLNTIKQRAGALQYDLHFWLGESGGQEVRGSKEKGKRTHGSLMNHTDIVECFHPNFVGFFCVFVDVLLVF